MTSLAEDMVSPKVLSLLAEHGWQRQPLVIRKAFSSDFLTEQDTFDAWRAFVESVDPPRWANRARLYCGSARVSSVEQFLPEASDTSWNSYLRRLGNQTGSSEWGLCLTDPQIASAKIFRRLLVFLDSLYRHIGIPRGGCSPDLFMMNHKMSFFRLHKDAQDVFTFVISGWRRFLLWPFNTFADIAGLGANKSRSPHRLYEVDHEAYRSQAMVLEAAAGDLLYWPAEWWHVGESNRERAITLGVGAIHDANPMSQFVRAADRRLQHRQERAETLPWDTINGAVPTTAAYTEWLQSFLEEDEFWMETRRGVMSWATRCGLKHIPPPTPVSTPLDDMQWLAITSPSTIAFEEDETSLFCSVAGHSLVLTPGAPAKALLTTLSRGGVHQVGTLIDDALAACQSAVSREQLRGLLETIEARYGCERLDAPASVTL